MGRAVNVLRLLHRFTLNPCKRTIHKTATRLTQEPMSSSGNLHTILNENTTNRYTIEYDGFLSNHISHALIALERLGASPNRLERFVNWYRPRLEHPTDADKTEIVDPETIPSLLGKEVSFYAILRHYENLMDNKYGSVEHTIAAEFPKLSAGIAGAAFHGAIQLGYSYTVNHQRSILEALAYLHFAYRPVTSKTDESWSKNFGNGDTDILDVFTSICNDQPLRDDMLVGEKQDPRNEKKTGTFQKRTDYLLTKRGDALIYYAKSIKLPESVYENGAIDPIKLGKQILEWAITVYAISEVPNDFFLLHGVTCTWSMCQIVPVLNREDGIRLLSQLVVGIAAAYMSQNSPKLSGKLDSGLKVTTEVWNDLIKETLAEDRDEHVYKLVQIDEDTVNSVLYITLTKNVITETFTIVALFNLILNRDNNGQSVSCHLTHATTLHTPKIATSIIQAYYAPDVEVTTINVTVLVTAVITCTPSGFPAIYTYSDWRHSWPGHGKVTHSETLGNNQTLRLTSLTYQRSCVYHCSARNGVNGSLNPNAGYGSSFLKVGRIVNLYLYLLRRKVSARIRHRELLRLICVNRLRRVHTVGFLVE